MILRACLVGVLLAVPAAAQVKGPQDVTVPVGRLASVPLTVEGDESDYQVLGSDVDAFREYTPDPKQLRLRLIGYAPGTAYVVVASTKGGRLQPLYKVTVTVTGVGPVPPVPPVPPGPVPPTPPEPAPPIAGDGFKVLIVYEKRDQQKLTAGQLNTIFGQKFRDYVAGKNGEYLILDKDEDVSVAGKAWKDAMRRPRAGHPWILISNGKTGYEGPLPAHAEEINLLLRKYGGQ